MGVLKITVSSPPPPDKNICEQKVSKLQCTVMAGIVLRPSGVLFIKTCFCRSRKSASQQNLLCPQFVRWNDDETEVKNISNGDILNRKLKDTWNEIWVLGDLVGTIHPPFVTKAPSQDSIEPPLRHDFNWMITERYSCKPWRYNFVLKVRCLDSQDTRF